jgi:two-component system response regulator MprA
MQPDTDGVPRLTALVVEDDVCSIAEFVRIGLTYERFQVHVCDDGAAAIRLADRIRPDVVVLDWMLPGMDGLEVCKRLQAFGNPAVLMLTAKEKLPDRVNALESGADDYVVKPFHFEELVARIHAILRRRNERALGPRLRVADLELDPVTREVVRHGRTVELTPREFDVLKLLMEQPRRVYSKRAILDRVWGYDFAGDDNIVEVYIGYLREKLSDRTAQRLIRTMRGAGYTLRGD